MRLIISSEDDPGRDALTGRKNAVTHTMTIQVDIPQSWTLEPVFKLKNWFIMNWNSKFPDRPISGRHSLMLNSDGVTVNDADVVRDFFEEGEQCYVQRGSRLPLSPSKVVGVMAKASVVARRKRMDARAAEIEAQDQAQSPNDLKATNHQPLLGRRYNTVRWVNGQNHRNPMVHCHLGLCPSPSNFPMKLSKN